MLCRRTNHGFTLIELLIVVIILGVLAGIVMGLARSASMDSRIAGTQETVRQTQQGIHLYREYTGQLPNLIASWSPLTDRTTVSGVTVGPFLDRRPTNSVGVGFGVANPSCITDSAAPSVNLSTCTFLYDYQGGNGSGRFIAAYDP